MRARRPAVFLDRDGTIIAHVHYLSEPGQVRLLEGAAEALRRLRAAGYGCVVVTNQSGIGRGMYTEAQLDAVHARLSELLEAEGTAIDGYYHCPVVPTSEDPTHIDHPDRKPAPGMLLRAAEELGLDLSASWMIGDMVSDALAGQNAGCKGSILVKTGKALPVEGAHPGIAYEVADDLLDATERILGNSGSTVK